MKNYVIASELMDISSVRSFFSVNPTPQYGKIHLQDTNSACE